jgi:hypothetical protein
MKICTLTNTPMNPKVKGFWGNTGINNVFNEVKKTKATPVFKKDIKE